MNLSILIHWGKISFRSKLFTTYKEKVIVVYICHSSIQDAGHPSSAAASPSPSAESGLLSLPWELVTHIASHLPAQCVISVLPQVHWVYRIKIPCYLKSLFIFTIDPNVQN